MKKRIEHLEDQTIVPGTEADQLIALGIEWRNAKKDWLTALEAREKAEPIFNKYPEWKDTPPKGTGKLLYIVWFWFVHFLEPKYRDAYKQAVTLNQWPPTRHLNDAE